MRSVEALNAGDSTTDTFTVTTVDGTQQQVTVSIHGTNDASVITGTSTTSITTPALHDALPIWTPTASGTLTDTDVDNTPNSFTAVAAGAASDHGYGSYAMTAAGVWTYTLDNSNRDRKSVV